MKVCVVIPLYNEVAHIKNVLKNVRRFNLPVIVVDDGSKDGSSNNLQNDIILLKHKINLGKGAAMTTGCEYAFVNGYDAVIFMDSDGQHNANDLTKFTDKLESGKYDLVLGSRTYNYAVPLVRYIGNKIASLVISLLFHIYASDSLCGFRGITKQGYEKIKWESLNYGVETEMLARAGKTHVNFCEVPVATIYHDSVKGVSMLDAFGILFNVLKWKLTL